MVPSPGPVKTNGGPRQTLFQPQPTSPIHWTQWQPQLWDAATGSLLNTDLRRTLPLLLYLSRASESYGAYYLLMMLRLASVHLSA